MKTIQTSAGEGKYIVEGVAVICGEDVSVAFCGGDRYHIGASALAVPRPSLADKTKPSASCSVICATGHKEDQLARSAALELATLLECRVNVVAGIHIDHASPADIGHLEKHFNEVLDGIKTELQQHYKA